MRLSLVFILVHFSFVASSQPDTCTSESVVQYLEQNEQTANEQLVTLELGKCAKAAGDLTKARGLLLDALQMAEYHSDTKTATIAHFYLGAVYFDIENALEAIYHLNKSLHDQQNLDFHQIAQANNLMGIIYLTHGENKKAIDYFNISIQIRVQNQQDLTEPFDYLYNNKGICFSRLEEYDSAFTNHKRCLRSRVQRQDTFAIGQSYYNLGALHFELEAFDSAKFYYERSLYMRSEASKTELSAIVESELGLANVDIEMGYYDDAEKLMERANNEIASGLLSTEISLRLHKAYMNLYHKTGRYKMAFEASEKYYHTRDSLFGLDKREALIRANITNQYEQKQKQDSLLAAEQIHMAQLEEKKEKELREQQEKQYVMIGWGAAIAFILLLGILILIYRNYKSKKRSSEAILEQKNEVEHQRDIAEMRRKDLEVVNAEITDSINYAKRIQNAIMPAEQYVSRALKDYFVIYLPKAIVAGDFFWVQEENGLVYFAAADCTGHGVPGALVSIICSNALNRSIEEFECVTPAEILDQSTALLSQTFEKSDEDVRDGMDIALCAWDQKKNVLQFSGANNPVYIIRNTETEPELEVYKGDRHAVGWKEEDQPFTNHSIPCNEGDLVYTFTDGFPDQFGGPKGKKYKYAQLKANLLEIAHLPMQDQKEALINAFDEWKGDFEQIDDVCIIGFRVGP